MNTDTPTATDHCDAVVVGAGFAGMYMLHRFRQQGLTVRVIEAGSGVGGTWYWNRYPGARCDVPSVEYSYSFDEELQQEWDWSEKYSGQPEILSYANHVADRFDLRDDITFDTRVEGAAFDESTSRWIVRTDTGEAIDTQFVVMATGCLSSANMPDIAGVDDFAGETFHTGRWPHDGVDFEGKRVAVVGTGSSGIQAIPIIADQCDELTVFQRTPNYSVPIRNEPLDPEYVASIKAEYSELRAANRLQNGAFGSRTVRGETPALEVDEDTRAAEYAARWEQGGFGFLAAYPDLLLSREANETAADFARRKIAEIVEDADTVAKLLPEQVIGCKRPCLDTGYFETYNKDHVSLVDIAANPIEKINASGLVVGGEQYDVDIIVFATGFDAMTGTLLKMDVRGRDGQTLQEAWSEGPRTYLGLTVPKFPNLFVVSGPGSPSVLTNMIPSIEQHVEWIDECVGHLRGENLAAIEASDDAATAWVSHVNEIADATLYPSCNSWYLGVNIPGKPRVFMPLIGFPPYVEKCEEVVANGYEGFVLTDV